MIEEEDQRRRAGHGLPAALLQLPLFNSTGKPPTPR
jgi:hypothetical protein